VHDRHGIQQTLQRPVSHVECAAIVLGQLSLHSTSHFLYLDLFIPPDPPPPPALYTSCTSAAVNASELIS
jgi:hypothetical protein